ncbi:uncharacterized protein LOC131690151 [Topomyia yanbarensis]|uniref:uncharacterized protein LOC131690151 n=1 Tax=Topomyia yanbarensis TaxID=2498891 RepID=UPI00273B02C0|nr:uncharacterized protein LOC131690151 [Topomyia yanbarensis]XP_058831694.1 uncharacterized protein LOC131690151 [Topomyia yanbarensis]
MESAFDSTDAQCANNPDRMDNSSEQNTNDSNQGDNKPDGAMGSNGNSQPATGSTKKPRPADWVYRTKSQRKRLRHYLEQGLSQEEAWKKAQEPHPQTQTPPSNSHSKSNARLKSFLYNKKRGDRGSNRSNNNSGNSQMGGGGGGARPPRINYEKMISKAIKVAIVPDDPNKPLDAEEASQIRNLVLQLMVTQKGNNNIKPQFMQDAVLQSGKLVFHCSDQATASWLEEQDCWPNQGCSAIREPEIAEEFAIIGDFKHTAHETTDFILGLVEAQNDILTSGWKTFNRQDFGTQVVLTLEVDPESWQKLEQMNFEVTFGYGQKVQLKPASTISNSGSASQS